MKGWHTAARNSVCNDSRKLRVGKVSHSGTIGDIRGLLASVAVQTVAARTGGSESTLAGSWAGFEIFFPRVLSARDAGNRQRENHGEQEDPLHGKYSDSIQLENKFSSQLQNARRPSRTHKTKGAGIDGAVRIAELRVIEKIKRIDANLKFLRLGNLG